MKKLVIVVTALAFTLGAVAQSEAPVKSEAKKTETKQADKVAPAPVKSEAKKPATKEEHIAPAPTPAKSEAKKADSKHENKKAAKPAKAEAKSAEASKSQGMEHKSESGKAHQSPNATDKKAKKKSAVKPVAPPESEVKGGKK